MAASYRANTDIDYTSASTSLPAHADAGESVEDLPTAWIPFGLGAGYITEEAVVVPVASADTGTDTSTPATPVASDPAPVPPVLTPAPGGPSSVTPASPVAGSGTSTPAATPPIPPSSTSAPGGSQ